ncbi:Lipoxygenase [Glonium stellatum]|uniref:Manganese lipoxygenase n=1 Tax=Glonium stellatum TaxID=574774 RepID=A0A8E2JQZ9_9PEZI|nr:Lipoxygenase [Glonium stellatum]
MNLLHLFFIFCVGATTALQGGITSKLRYRRDSVGATNQTSLPQFDHNPGERANAILVKRRGYLYGPSKMGNASFFPTGNLGDAMVANDLSLFTATQEAVQSDINTDAVAVQVAVETNGGLKSFADYANILYNGQWSRAVPSGEDPGILSNYTEDLLFSMERLSLNPYAIRRLTPQEILPFELGDVGDSILQVAEMSITALQQAGRLFLVDHSYQAKYPTTGRFGAACSAYFFIHPTSGDFLPLAIKTNVGNDLVYTPLDAPNDWLLAKIMFNVNDLFFAQIYHLVATHDVGEIVHQAAIRTLSDNHPILAILDKLMFQAYGIRPTGDAVLFNNGGAIDTYFYLNSTAARDFVADWYPIAGAYRANYFNTFLENRGLLNCDYGPALKSFPYHEDASIIHKNMQIFMNSFIDSYYQSDKEVEEDFEVQAWVTEARNEALVIDFPELVTTKGVLIDILTHFFHLTGVAHHVLNTADPVTSLGTLPFHPAALYHPIPTSKNVTDLLPFLPPPATAIGQIGVFAAFNRAHFAAQNLTLAHAFSDPALLSRLNVGTNVAASKFSESMRNISAQIRGRAFDADGLSQGMPFVWKCLDPETLPFFFAV